jgi:hypothetical protein
MNAIYKTYQLARKQGLGRKHALGWAIMDSWPTLAKRLVAS